MNPMLRMLLGFANVPDQAVTDLQNDLPAMARLDALAHEVQGDIDAAAPLVAALIPIVARLWPKEVEAWPDLKTVGPVADEFLKLFNKGN